MQVAAGGPVPKIVTEDGRVCISSNRSLTICALPSDVSTRRVVQSSSFCAYSVRIIYLGLRRDNFVEYNVAG